MSMLQQDTIQAAYAGGQTDSVIQHHPLTPAQVLSWLPRSASPAQQDSAIQAHFQPSEIRWSTRPDTLHLPGHDKGHNLLDINIPQYYREGFFSKDTLFHPELPGGRYGTAGDPVPYSAHGDHILTLLLLSCFIMAVVAFSNVRDFFVRQAKNFFYVSHGVKTEVTETANELRFQLFLVFLTGLQLALLYYFYTLHFIGDTFALRSQYHLVIIFLAIVLAYFLLKALFYTAVNNVFFGGKINGQWMRALLFITAIEGVLLFPDVVLQAYFDLSPKTVIIYCVVVLVFIKFLTFYKCYVIFFIRNVVSLQIILYFCALEMVPLLILWGVLGITANSLKIIF